MKKILLPVVLLTVLFSACKTESNKDIETSRQLLLTPDTNNLYRDNTGADVAKTEEKIERPKQNNYVAPRRVIQPRYKAPQQRRAPIVASAPPVVVAPAPVATPAVIASTPATTGTAPAGNTAPVAKTETKKKGMSDATKGAVIGGVGGAVAGAVIGKNGRGAIIGGVLGAAGGYILGRQKDRKTNKVEYVVN